MKKINNLLILTTLIAGLCATGCGEEKDVPYYEGMSFENKNETVQKLNIGLLDEDDEEDDEEDDDFSDELENPIDKVVNIDVNVKDEVEYYVEPNEIFIIKVHIHNPENYEIQSFTLNGAKYANYMFKEGSTMECLLLETTAPSKSGYMEYTIDAIKYIDGTEIKDVDMRDAEKTIKAGITYMEAPSVTNVSKVVKSTQTTYNFTVNDPNNLLGNEYLKCYLSDGVKNVFTKDIVVGENIITIKNLYMQKAYEFGILGAFDLVDGRDFHAEWLYTNTFKTIEPIVFKSITPELDSLSFELDVIDEDVEVTAIELNNSVNHLLVDSILPEERTFTTILNNSNVYIIVAYQYMHDDEKILGHVRSTDVLTPAKEGPVVSIKDVISTQDSIDYSIEVTDIQNTFVKVTEVNLIKEDKVIATNNGELTGSFTGLLSDTLYTIEAKYEYDLNDTKGVIIGTANHYETTVAKSSPLVTFNKVTPTKESISYELNITDIDNTGHLESVELYLGTNLVSTIKENAVSGTFENLRSNTEYKLVSNYVYNLNDEKGEFSLQSNKTIRTLKKVRPSVEADYAKFSGGDIMFSLRTIDFDDTLKLGEAELLYNEVPVQTLDLMDESFGIFYCVDHDYGYQVLVHYTIDMQDGTPIENGSILMDVAY